MIGTISAFTRRIWRGEDPPLATFGFALLVGLFAYAAAHLLTLWAMRSLDDLKVITIVEGIGDLTGLGILLWAVMGVLRSIWKAVGRPSLWMTVAIVFAAIAIAAFVIPKFWKLRESFLILIDRDPVGNPAKIFVRDGEIIFDGSITYGAARKFREVAERAKSNARLVITSSGGRELEAGKIAAEVARRKMSVYAPDTCESACTTILIASPNAIADVHASIGFHQSTRDGANAAENRMMSDSVKDQMLEAGVDSAFVAKALKTAPSDMWYPSASELLSAHVVNQVESAGTLKEHARWLHDGNLPYLIGDDVLLVDAKAIGRRLELDFGYVPGSAKWRDPPARTARQSSISALLCQDDYYRPLLDHDAAIAMIDVASGVETDVVGKDCSHLLAKVRS